MGARSGRRYLDSLCDDRQIWIDGELVSDVTKDRRFAAAAYSMAELYDMQHDATLTARLTYASPTSAEPVGLSFIQPKTIDRRIRRPAIQPDAKSRRRRGQCGPGASRSCRRQPSAPRAR